MGGLDFGVGIDKRQVELVRHSPSDRGLASSHHADEHDHARAERANDRGFFTRVDQTIIDGIAHQSTLNLAPARRHRRSHLYYRGGSPC